MYKLGELALHINAELVGDAECSIERVATLSNARSGDISFLANSRFENLLSTTRASAVIVAEQYRSALKTNGIIAADPHVAYAKIATLLYPADQKPRGIHQTSTVGDDCSIADSSCVAPSCVIGSSVTIGNNTFIGPGSVIEDGVRIGDDCCIVANVTICHNTQIGSRTTIHPGVVIGSDGFGLGNDNGHWIKVPQIGNVQIGNDVEIGSNTTIDRGTIEDTVIEDGTKIDNLVQVAHNVKIGEHTAIAGCTGIAGSAIIGNYCQLGGGVGVVGHLEITDNVQVTGMSKVSSSISKPGVYSSGTPIEPYQKWKRNTVRIKQLDDIARRLKKLEQQINQPKK